MVCKILPKYSLLQVEHWIILGFGLQDALLSELLRLGISNAIESTF